MDKEMNWKEYLVKNGLPEHLAVTVKGDTILIGEWLEQNMIRNLLETTDAYGLYSKALGVQMVEDFYDAQVLKMYVARVSACIDTGGTLQCYGDFCELAIPRAILDEKEGILEDIEYQLGEQPNEN